MGERAGEWGRSILALAGRPRRASAWESLELIVRLRDNSRVLLDAYRTIANGDFRTPWPWSWQNRRSLVNMFCALPAGSSSS